MDMLNTALQRVVCLLTRKMFILTLQALFQGNESMWGARDVISLEKNMCTHILKKKTY